MIAAGHLCTAEPAPCASPCPYRPLAAPQLAEESNYDSLWVAASQTAEQLQQRLAELQASRVAEIARLVGCRVLLARLVCWVGTWPHLPSTARGLRGVRPAYQVASS